LFDNVELSLFDQFIKGFPQGGSVLNACGLQQARGCPFLLFLKSLFDSGCYCRASDVGGEGAFTWFNLIAMAGKRSAFLLLLKQLFNQLKRLDLSFVVGGKLFL